MSRKWRVLLADGHRMVRAGIKSVLMDLEAVEIVGEADDGLSIMGLVQQNEPDLVLMELWMRGMNAVDVIREIRKKAPRVRCAVLSTETSAARINEVLKAGARAFVSKDDDAETLIAALDSVMTGGTFITQHMASADPVVAAPASVAALPALTPRQRTILKLMAEGRRTREVASDLRVSIKTVETHRAHLIRRLGVAHTAGLVRAAIRMGLIQQPATFVQSALSA